MLQKDDIIMVFCLKKNKFASQLAAMYMRPNSKKRYEAPVGVIIDERFEGIICDSSDGVEAMHDGYGNAEEYNWV